MGVDELGGSVLAGSAVLLVAVLAVRLSSRTGLPSLLLYLGLGVALGWQFFRGREDLATTEVIGYAALAVILAEGGLTTRWSSLRGAIAPAAVLATVGTAVSVAVVGAAVHVLLGWPWTVAVLLGAVISSTDAAAVFSVLRRVPLPARLRGLLEAESGFNDAPVVIAVVALTGIAAAPDPGGEVVRQAAWWRLPLQALLELAGGAAVGLAVGVLAAALLRRAALPASGLYPVAVVSACALAYGGASEAGVSGFLAVYLAALVLGNAELPHGVTVRGFAEGLGWLAQIGLFVLLGVVVTPSHLPRVVVPALVAGAVLLLLARPLSVLVSTVWFKVPWREQVFLSWAGLRGAVPVVLTTVPVLADVPGAEDFFELVFLLVVVFTLLQAPTLPLVARRLGLDRGETRPLEVESSPLGAIGADLLTARIGPGSHLAGVEVFELRLPDGAQVTLLIRDGAPVVPGPRTVLRHGDDLVVVTVEGCRDATMRRLHDVSESGRLARWRATEPTPGARPRRLPPWLERRPRPLRRLRHRPAPPAGRARRSRADRRPPAS